MKNQAELFLITPENLALFSGLLTAEAAARVGDPRVLTLGAARNNLACGALCAEFDEAAGDVLSLFVAEDCRRQGAGCALLEGLAASAGRIGSKRLQIVCEPEAVPGLGSFLSAMGFVCTQTIPRFRLTLEQLSLISLPEVSLKEVYPLSQLSTAALRGYNLLVQKEPERLLYLDPAEVEPELSAFCLTQDKKLGGFTALSRGANGLELINTYGSPECLRQLPALFRFSLNAARAALPPETPVLMDAVTPPSEQLLRHLLKGLDARESRVDTYELPL